MAMKVPVKLPASVVADAVIAAVTAESAGCSEAGLVTPGIENAIDWPAGNDPAVNETDRTVLLNEAVAAGVAVEEWLPKVTPCPGEQETPEEPVSVMARTLREVIGTEGVTNTLIVTPVAAAIGVLRVIAGWFRPRLPMITGNVPVELTATV